MIYILIESVNQRQELGFVGEDIHLTGVKTEVIGYISGGDSIEAVVTGINRRSDFAGTVTSIPNNFWSTGDFVSNFDTVPPNIGEQDYLCLEHITLRINALATDHLN